MGGTTLRILLWPAAFLNSTRLKHLFDFCLVWKDGLSPFKDQQQHGIENIKTLNGLEFMSLPTTYNGLNN